ncbi:A-kinase anchor protein 14 [Varanus komodoensis]|uniref:A-kinase anchor protein 14 n=1 Tax=Varanus komodoensis TaxID=61221 RepID=UPI001CF7E7C8|nr:A-kinase anchor protein 14 [Varanus komodoensis]
MEELTTDLEDRNAAEEEDEGALQAINDTAGLIVSDVIQRSKDALREKQKKQAELYLAGAKYEVPNIIWMKCQDFTVGKGVQQIEDYMRTWELHESWLHWTNYLGEEKKKYSIQYYYRVRWSIPTCRKPIPRATACVYFIIEVSQIKPPTLPVEVFFLVETNKLIHRPGECRFKEKWLKDVIESKIILMETVDF